jgi:hypothetical protein
MLKILNSSLQLQAVVKNVLSPLISEEINREFTFSFVVVIDGEKSQYINTDNKVEVENNYFDIVYTKEQRNSDDTVIVRAECEHVSYELNDGDNILNEGFTDYGTPEQLLTRLFDGTPFIVGQVDFTEAIIVSINEKCTKRGVLLHIAKLLGGELKFDKFEISLLTRRGADRGVQFRYRKNNISVSRETDKRYMVDGQPAVAYEVDVAELEFAQGYGPDEHYELGDTVQVIDPGLNINTPQRIVRESHNPFDRMKGKVAIANFIPDINDTIVTLQQKSVMKEAIYNNVQIGPKRGFVATRSDKKVETEMNGTKGISVKKGDGSGSNWTDMFWVDTEGNLRMKDAFIELMGTLCTILLNPNVGIKISNGNGDILFFDPETGKLKIVGDAEFSGDISGSVITGGEVNGTEINGVNISGSVITGGEVNGAEINGTNIYGSNFHGADENSAYVKVGGSANLADFGLFRGETTKPLFRIFDALDGIDISVNANGDAGTLRTFLSTIGSASYPKGDWDFSSSNASGLEDSGYATRDYVDNLMAQHIAEYHT